VVAEVLRSGAYSDEVVTNLVRRRFVAVMYDVAPPGQNFGDGWAYDREANALIDLEKLRRGQPTGGAQEPSGRVHAESYPAALFLLPDGTLLGNGLWDILPPETMVRELRAVMARWPEHFPIPAEEMAVRQVAERHPEDAAAALAVARLCWELAEFEAVLPHCDESVLAHATPAQRDELLYLRGRALCCLHRDTDARKALEAVQPAGELAAAVQVALARLDMHAGSNAAALQRLTPLLAFDQPQRWTGTAMYCAGLCEHRLGHEAEARALWRRHRAELPFDRLARRSAASLGLDEAEAFLNQELLETKGWW
jgi:tetratricopeptide (TPR) repeat protein